MDPSRKSVLNRLATDMAISFKGSVHNEGSLQISGSVHDRDQLDALMTVLATIREWVSPFEHRQCDREDAAAPAGEAAVSKPDAEAEREPVSDSVPQSSAPDHPQRQVLP